MRKRAFVAISLIWGMGAIQSAHAVDYKLPWPGHGIRPRFVPLAG